MLTFVIDGLREDTPAGTDIVHARWGTHSCAPWDEDPTGRSGLIGFIRLPDGRYTTIRPLTHLTWLRPALGPARLPATGIGMRADNRTAPAALLVPALLVLSALGWARGGRSRERPAR